MVSYLTKVELAAHFAFFQMILVFQLFPMGSAPTQTSIIGNKIGEGNIIAVRTLSMIS